MRGGQYGGSKFFSLFLDPVPALASISDSDQALALISDLIRL